MEFNNIGDQNNCYRKNGYPFSRAKTHPHVPRGVLVFTHLGFWFLPTGFNFFGFEYFGFKKNGTPDNRHPIGKFLTPLHGGESRLYFCVRHLSHSHKAIVVFIFGCMLNPAYMRLRINEIETVSANL